MLKIPDNILVQYEAILTKKVPAVSVHSDYKKWLRYFLDFCGKYPVPDSKSERVRLFIEKLREKKQTPDQQKQAAYAVSLYFEILRNLDNKTPSVSVNSNTILSPVPDPQPPKRVPEAEYAEKSVSPEWDKVIADLASEIKTRHYSRRTLKAYALWSRQFQKFLRDKPPHELSSADVKEYLTYLAVKCHVAASTQNQAFNALLFVFRHVLKKDFGDHRDVPRAKRSRYIPVVLSRREIDTVLKHLEYPYDLVVKLLYGCGLRLFECLQLRVKDFNFDAEILTIHGKGKKDRTVPIPQTIVPELTAQLEAVSKLHDEDLAAGFTGVFLDSLLEKKYPSAAKDFIWQWFFPQKTLTPIPGTKELRRYHLHETHVQRALYEAVRRARLTKRVSSHTFRHSFATHLLQANYDIRTIQELLGHSDVKTTMIYTHCVPSRTVKEAKSPLDF
ncbi:MAG: integron integrase [Desulfovibrionales bacterium]|nr:integron integrase [Desulfovibrionales bacterium]